MFIKHVIKFNFLLLFLDIAQQSYSRGSKTTLKVIIQRTLRTAYKSQEFYLGSRKSSGFGRGKTNDHL